MSTSGEPEIDEPFCKACGKLPCFSCEKELAVDSVVRACACDSCASCTSSRTEYIPPELHSDLRICSTCGVLETKERGFQTTILCLPCLLASYNEVWSSGVAKLSFPKQTDPGDVFFVVNGIKCIEAHRSVLAAMSPMFQAMMKLNMKEKLSGVIQIEGMSAAVVRAAVSFMYTGEVEFSDEVPLRDMLNFSHQYQIRWLQDVCEIKLGMEINSGNVFEMLSISYRLGARKLKIVAKKYFNFHLDVHDTLLDHVFETL